MSRQSEHAFSTLGRALLVITFVLTVHSQVWPASRTIDIVINSLVKTDGQLSGSESFSLEEHKKLSGLQDAGEPALAGCLLDAWQTRKLLTELGLTVRRVESAITRDRYELSWQADFTELPTSYGPLSALNLTPTDKGAREYRFSALLGHPGESSKPVTESSLKDLAVTVRVRFPGTVQNHITGPGRVDHTGESVTWTTQATSLGGEPVQLAARVTPGRASEQRYWLVLMVSLTVVMLIVMVGVLRRGARNTHAKQS